MSSYVVGVDSSPASLSALRWTQELAKRTGADVKAVTVWIMPPSDVSGVPYPMDPLQEAAEAVLERSLAAVPADGVERTGEAMVHASIPWGLIEAAADADLLVVGTRPHSTFERVLGAVAIQCAQHAQCPFIAVPESAPDPGDLVAVAYDGSDTADTALRWAVSVTSGTDLRLRIIAVWEKNASVTAPFVVDESVALDDRALEGLKAAVRNAVPDIDDDVEYRPVFGPGKVTPHLLDGAEDASLLVVGSRGRGGFSGLLLGSVSQRCLEASAIPVAVIRG